MIADSGTFSDGEQQLLPVLSNKEHLVETLPMPVRGEETRTFSLDRLFNQQSKTATDRKLTVRVYRKSGLVCYSGIAFIESSYKQ